VYKLETSLKFKYLTLEDVVVDDLKLRSYQEELCVEALKGNNCIICAPTGSGKTIVAAHVIREHLRRRLKEQKTARVPTYLLDLLLLCY